MAANTEHEDLLLDQAAAWVARLRGSKVKRRDREQFALWLAESPAHRDAFDSMLELWLDLQVAKALPLEIPDIAARGRHEAARSWLWPSFGASAAAIFIAFLVTLYPGGEAGHTEFLQTAVGEQLQQQLPDGSKLDLNTDTRLEVVLSSDSRQIRFDRGEAFFDVASDRQRPFVAACGPATATAIGTAFSVRCEADRTEVTVSEGIVRVGGADAATATLVKAGQHMVFHHDSGQGTLGTGEQERRLAWLDQNLIFIETPLVQVVAELQRYTSSSIRLADTEIANIRVSGVFNVRDPAMAVSALAESLPIESRQLSGGQILLIPARG